MPGNVLHDLKCILEHWCFPINASLQHVRTCTPTHRSSTFTIKYITIFQSNSSPRFPKDHLFFLMGPWTLSSWHWNAIGLSEKLHLTAVVSPWKFPSFPVAIGPMNLVPSVKPGARELNASESSVRWLGGFSESGNPPKSHISFRVSGVSQEILEGICGSWGSVTKKGPLWNICPGATWQQIFCTEPGVAAILAGLYFGEHGPRMFQEVSSWKVPVELNHCRFQLVAAMHSRCSWHQEHGRLGKFPIGRQWP